MSRATETLLCKASPTGLAASVAPEDLECGDFVAILSVTHEYPSFFWCCDASMSAREEPVRIQWTGIGESSPLKVKAICLPFVLAKDAAGKHRTLDIRLCRLARLTPDYGRKVWKALRRNGTK
jgi:hypothetical protein